MSHSRETALPLSRNRMMARFRISVSASNWPAAFLGGGGGSQRNVSCIEIPAAIARAECTCERPDPARWSPSDGVGCPFGGAGLCNAGLAGAELECPCKPTTATTTVVTPPAPMSGTMTFLNHQRTPSPGGILTELYYRDESLLDNDPVVTLMPLFATDNYCKSNRRSKFVICFYPYRWSNEVGLELLFEAAALFLRTTAAAEIIRI
jgi:hypothetical protein